MSRPTIVLAGGGLAAATAAKTLREEGFDGRVMLFSAEAEPPYQRPPLSKGYLAGTASGESLAVHEHVWYTRHEIDLRLGTALTQLDPHEDIVHTAGGQAIRFDQLLIATGAGPRRLSVPGVHLGGVHYLRGMDDARSLSRELATGSRRVVIIGGGWIGLEVAATARGHGNHVSVIEHHGTLLRRSLGDQLGRRFAVLHRHHEVDLHLATDVTAIHGSRGLVQAVTTADGRTIPADVVLVGIGAITNTALARSGALDVGTGVRVDATHRTDRPGVFAAGDVAEVFNPLVGRHLSGGHWAAARHGGASAARSMLDLPPQQTPLPSFFTDQYELGMEYRGLAGPHECDQVVVRHIHPGEPGEEAYLAFWLSEGRIQAAMNVNVWDVGQELEDLVRQRMLVDPHRLADPHTPLPELAACRAAQRRS